MWKNFKSTKAFEAAGEALNEAFKEVFRDTESGSESSLQTDDMNVKVKDKKAVINGDVDSVTVNGKEVYKRGT